MDILLSINYFNIAIQGNEVLDFIITIETDSYSHQYYVQRLQIIGIVVQHVHTYYDRSVSKLNTAIRKQLLGQINPVSNLSKTIKKLSEKVNPKIKTIGSMLLVGQNNWKTLPTTAGAEQTFS